MQDLSVSGNIVDIINRKIFPGTLVIRNGKIEAIKREDVVYHHYICPGFIDAHVHIESSILIPSEFARLAVVHGTVATVSDPHEIGNVLGVDGVRYMLQNSKQVPFHFYFGAPSCVPATRFETSGASITAQDIFTLLSEDKLLYLSEMMNFPGVLQKNPEVMKKIQIAKDLGKPIDGHAPGLRGEEAKKYISAGISTDHECFKLDEALEKVRYGMHILIREGSAAKNFETLHPLIASYPDKVMFCSDDKHPHELIHGHINTLVRRSVIDKGYDSMDVLRCACLNPIVHYKLDVGLLRCDDWADFIVIDNLQNFSVLQTYVKGNLVAEKGKTKLRSVDAEIVNNFFSYETTPQDFMIQAKGSHIRVIEALEGELITNNLKLPAKIDNGLLVSDTINDVLKIAVVNRYKKTPPTIGFIHHFGLKKGAIASSVAHDSHNIIAVGVTDQDLSTAVNVLMEQKGGIAAVSGKDISVLPLPIAGLMSNEDGYLVAKKYLSIDHEAKKLGTHLQAPFMTLSFMALLVIPSLKLSDKGLFDVDNFSFVDVSMSLEKGHQGKDKDHKDTKDTR
jgi:adenine deaminase